MRCQNTTTCDSTSTRANTAALLTEAGTEATGTTGSTTKISTAGSEGMEGTGIHD